MKTAILISNEVKQIMFTPENNAEKQALKYISPNEDVHTVIKTGTFYDREPNIFGVNVYECMGGYLRAEDNPESVMFVITPKKEGEKV
jgi:hypothetical protein